MTKRRNWTQVDVAALDGIVGGIDTAGFSGRDNIDDRRSGLGNWFERQAASLGIGWPSFGSSSEPEPDKPSDLAVALGYDEIGRRGDSAQAPAHDAGASETSDEQA